MNEECWERPTCWVCDYGWIILIILILGLIAFFTRDIWGPVIGLGETTASDPSSGLNVVEEETVQVNAGAGATIAAGNATVTFSPGSLVEDTRVTVAELGPDGTIASGILVDTHGTAIVAPALIRIPGNNALDTGLMAQLLQREGGDAAWQLAHTTTGEPIMGMAGPASQVFAVTDHFSALGLPERAEEEAGNVAGDLHRDTGGHDLENGRGIRVPDDVVPEHILKGVPLGFFGFDIPVADFPFADKGLNNGKLRHERYKELLVSLFLQTEIELDENLLDKIRTELEAGHVHYEVARAAAETGGEITVNLVKYSPQYRDFVRSFRSDALGWSKHARLDYTASRLEKYVKAASDNQVANNIAVAFNLAVDGMIVSEDVHRFFLYRALNDAVVLERMDRFGGMLAENPDLDPALRPAFEEAKVEVEKKLDYLLAQIVSGVMADWLANLQVAGHVVVVLQHKTLLALAHLNPGFAVLGAIRFYDEEIVNSYADLQRATLAATLVDDLENAQFTDDSETAVLDRSMTILYLGQFYYDRLHERRKGGISGAFSRLLLGIEEFLTGRDERATEQARLDYLLGKTEDFRRQYEEFETERLSLLNSGGPDPIELPDPVPVEEPEPDLPEEDPETLPDAGDLLLLEEFDSAAPFTATSPSYVYVDEAASRAVLNVSRSDQRMIYREIDSTGGDIRVTVTGRLDSAQNNCGFNIGLLEDVPVFGEHRSGVTVTYDWFGGGCSNNFSHIRASWAYEGEGATSTFDGYDCNVSDGTKIPMDMGVDYTAQLDVTANVANLVVKDRSGQEIGSLSGDVTEPIAEMNVLYLGLIASGDWPQCSGSVDRVTVERLP